MSFSRREALIRIGGAAGAALAPRLVSAQTAQKADPPSVISNPPRDFSGPVTYPDPDIITHDPSFNALRVGNTPIQRLWTGGMWCEGPAWNGQGQYLIWSDIPNNRQMRWIEDDARVTVFRQPSGNSNGNTFDHQGRQLSCEHSGPTRRALRARRLDHGDCRLVPGQAAELAERHRMPSGRQLLVHRSAVRRAALRRDAGRGGRSK